MKKILTISANDQGIAWGPAIHFLELWNSFTQLSGKRFYVSGLVPSWTRERPVTDVKFALRRVFVPNIPLIRQIIFDLVAGYSILRNRREIIYLRLSHWHFAVMLACKLGRIYPFLELNGIMKDDAICAKKSGLFVWLVSLQERWLIRRAKACFAVSEGIGEFAKGVGAKRVVEVPNGVASAFYSIPKRELLSRPVVVYVGTFTPWDGAVRVIELAQSFPGVDFRMIGDGAGREKLERQASSNVEFLGWTPYSELPDYYRDANAGIVLYESQRNDMVVSSLKTLEYVAAGLPVFTTRTPGQEFVAREGIGITCDLATVINCFASFLEDLETYSANIQNYRVGAGQVHSWDRAARQTLEEIMNHETS